MKREEVAKCINEYMLNEFGKEYALTNERLVGLAYTTFNEEEDGRCDEIQVYYDMESLRLITEINGEVVEDIDYPPEWIRYASFNELVGEWITEED